MKEPLSMLKDLELSSKLLLYVKKESEEIDMLTPYVEKENITLCYGTSGSGKTVFMINHLNTHKVIPLLIDFDGNHSNHFNKLGLDLQVEIMDGEEFIRDIFRDKQMREDLRGHTLIIDTWKMFTAFLCSKGVLTEMDALKRLQSLLRHIPELTIIIITHANCFSMKEDIPDMDVEVYSHINGRLNIKIHTTTTKRTYTLFLDKVRGYTGSKILKLREEVIEK